MLRLALAFLIVAVASTHGERVSCKKVDKGNGQYGFDCVTVVPTTELTAQNLYILWLKSSRPGGDNSVDITIPNYKIEDIIQAAAKGSDAAYKTNINVALQKPEFSYSAQKEEKVGQTTQDFDVNLNYERIQGRQVHFADEGQGSERYAQLNGQIAEPSGR